MMNVIEKREQRSGCGMELVVAGICCLLKIGIDGGGIVWASWLLVVTNLKKDTRNNEICTRAQGKMMGKQLKLIKTTQTS